MGFLLILGGALLLAFLSPLLGGRLGLRGTAMAVTIAMLARIPVSLVLGYLAAGKTAEEITAEFPDLTREQIAACLDYARDLAEFEVRA